MEITGCSLESCKEKYLANNTVYKIFYEKLSSDTWPVSNCWRRSRLTIDDLKLDIQL